MAFLHKDDLDKIISKWTEQQEHYQIMRILQEAGAVAGAVPTAKELFNDQYLRE